MEKFIKKFTNVVQANNWNPQAAHLNLGLSIEIRKKFGLFRPHKPLLACDEKNKKKSIVMAQFMLLPKFKRNVNHSIH